MKGKLLIIIGPSAGVGKNTILKMFLQKHPDWHHPPSTTTRPPRPGERPGIDMNFMSRDEFEAAVKQGKFLEWVDITGEWHGTLREPVEKLLGEGKNIAIIKEDKGAQFFKKLYPQTVVVVLLPDSWQALEKRIRQRQSDTPEIIEKRLALAKRELKGLQKYKNKVINPIGHPEKAVAEIERILGLS